jgi:hypothetical protein
MTDLLARDWKPLLLCFVLAALVWFLVNERRVQPVSPALPEPVGGLTPTLAPP